jgi:hypothetical protein
MPPQKGSAPQLAGCEARDIVKEGSDFSKMLSKKDGKYKVKTLLAARPVRKVIRPKLRHRDELLNGAAQYLVVARSTTAIQWAARNEVRLGRQGWATDWRLAPFYGRWRV